jgi:hypothetical protein
MSLAKSLCSYRIAISRHTLMENSKTAFVHSAGGQDNGGKMGTRLAEERTGAGFGEEL